MENVTSPLNSFALKPNEHYPSNKCYLSRICSDNLLYIESAPLKNGYLYSLALKPNEHYPSKSNFKRDVRGRLI